MGAGSAQQSVPSAPAAVGLFHIRLHSAFCDPYPVEQKYPNQTQSRTFPAAFLSGQTRGSATMFCEHRAAAEAVGPGLPAPRSWGGRCGLLHAQGHAGGSRRLPEPGVVLSPSEEIKNTWMLMLRHVARGVARCLLLLLFFLFPLTRKKTTFKKLWCSLLPCEHLRGGAAGMGCSHCRAGKAGGSLALGMSPVAAGRALTPAGHGECHGAPKDAVICCTWPLSEIPVWS